MSAKKKATNSNEEIIDEIFDMPPEARQNVHSNSKVLVIGFAAAALAGLVAGVVGVAVVLSGSLSGVPIFNLFSLESILPDQQYVVRQQQIVTVTIDEQLSNIAVQVVPTVVNFAVKSGAASDFASVYTNSDIIGTGIILTSDGWLAASQALFKGRENKEIVVVYGNNDVLEIEKIVTDSIAGISFIKINSDNLLVSQLAEDWELVSGKRLVALSFSFPSAQELLEEVMAVSYSEQNVLLNSDTAIRSVRLNKVLDQPYQPIFNLAGEVVGLSQPVDGESSVLILASSFMQTFENVLRTNEVNRPSLGLEWINLHGNPGLSEAIRQGRNKGGYISKLLPGSPAAEVGIKEGDIITMFNDQELNGRLYLSNLVQQHSPEDIVYLGIDRNGELLEFAVELSTLTD